MFVCLLAMHLDTVRASAANMYRNPLRHQEKVKSYFFPGKIQVLPLERPPLFPTNGIVVFLSIGVLLYRNP